MSCRFILQRYAISPYSVQQMHIWHQHGQVIDTQTLLKYGGKRRVVECKEPRHFVCFIRCLFTTPTPPSTPIIEPFIPLLTLTHPQKSPAEARLIVVRCLLAYAAFFLRAKPNPTRPKPIRARLAGSGTDSTSGRLAMNAARVHLSPSNIRPNASNE